MRNDSRCLSNSCQNNSTCAAGHREDTCHCADVPQDTMEELCNKTSDPCSSNPCLQNATCLSSPGNLSFTCECPTGYNGSTCERAVSVCDTNPCEHGGTCQNGLAGPICLCSAGYTGTLCETDFDECISEPCHNGAVCRDGVDEYSCYCVPGYQGKHCDLEVNECVSDPCLNGATCLNQIGKYDCICPLGYTGECHFKQSLYHGELPYLCSKIYYHTHLFSHTCITTLPSASAAVGILWVFLSPILSPATCDTRWRKTEEISHFPETTEQFHEHQVVSQVQVNFPLNKIFSEHMSLECYT